MVTIVRGTTPLFSVDFSNIPDYPNFNINGITSVSLIFKRRSGKIEKGLSDLIVDGNTNTLSYHFTQEETLAFIADEIITVDMHVVINGERSKVLGIPNKIKVENTEKNEVM